MRVAMGLALNEVDREARAIEFYNVLSTFDFMSSTPTLFNSGTHRSQLSSCYLTTVSDDLDGIYEAIKENALLSKFAGGLGNDWTNVRAMGSHIKGTNGKSQGVVPFLKVVNDTAVAVNQCFAPDTQVYTARGMRPIRDVQPRRSRPRQERRLPRSDRALCLQPARADGGDRRQAFDRADRGDRRAPVLGDPRRSDGAGEQARTNDWLAKGKVSARVGRCRPTAGRRLHRLHDPDGSRAVDGLTEDDARLYGILLGDGHLSKDGMQWGVSGNPQRDEHLEFVRAYLRQRGVHYWE